MVNRYGAMVDFWELMNEVRVDDVWYEHAIAYLQTIDPYRHPISTGFEFAQHSGIQINSPHWYQSEQEQDSGLIISQNASSWKLAGKPVIVGEQGNVFQNWDECSGLRMRLRLWTAMFSEGALVFWNSARFLPEIHPVGEAANIYLGPEERSYIRVVQDFSKHVHSDAVACNIGASAGVRAYGLCGSGSLHIYVHGFADHSQPTTQASLQQLVPKEGSLI